MNTQHLTRMIVLSLISLGLMVACGGAGSTAGGESPKVSVVCQVVSDAVNCTATEIEGTQNVTACWDVKINCKNGATSTASACEAVSATKPSIHILNEKEFTDIKRCRVTSMSVENIKVTKN